MTTRGASAEAIQHHYDVSNDFYRMWLDPKTMSYTSGIFQLDDPNQSLSDAQRTKVDYHAQTARAANQARVLDIGCGWGNMLFSLVRDHNVKHATGLTLSKAQRRHILDAGDPRIEVRLESYVDHAPESEYDAIVSVEAIEHFARFGLSWAEKVDIYRELFSKAHAWLKPGGWMSLQMTTYGNSCSASFDQFVAEEIFREADLPRLSEICAACDGLFSVETVLNGREHYVRTLRHWLAGLRSRRADAIATAGMEVYRRYDTFLRLSTYMFESGACDLQRIALRRIDTPRVRTQTLSTTYNAGAIS